MSFEGYGLNPEILSGLADAHIEKPTPLQNEVLLAVLQGKHVFVKNVAKDEGIFLIPALQKIAANGEETGTQVLILTPSIERAQKIDELVWAMGYHAQIRSVLLTMEGNKDEQEQAVLDGTPVIVANPGRLIEILEKNNFQLANLKLLVIDEAHTMENFNLVSRVKEILRFVSGYPQAIVLSETRNNATEQLVKVALKNPGLIGFAAGEYKVDVETENSIQEGEVDSSKQETEEKVVDIEATEEKLKKSSVQVVLKKGLPAGSVEGKSQGEFMEATPLYEGFEQGFINVPPRMKISTLMVLLKESKAKKVVIFATSKRTANRLFYIIKRESWGVVSVSSFIDEKTFSERFAKFSSGEMRVLLVGGMAANQIEIEGVQEVINYDIPNEVDEYQYRAELIGNGKATQIISLVSEIDKEKMDRISSEVGYTPVELPLPKQILKKIKKGRVKREPKSSSKNNVTAHKNSGKDSKAIKTMQRATSLPRPTYEGLSGGREGNKKSGSVFGWMKKLFG